MVATSNGGVHGTLGHTLIPTSDAELARQVVRLFDDAVAHPDERAFAAMETAGRELATIMRTTGFPPERAVIALKALLCRQGASHWFPSLAVHVGTRVRAEHVVYERLFSAWLDAYFRAKPGA